MIFVRMRQPAWKVAIIAGTCLIAAFVVYLTTLAPTFYNLDSAELAIGVHTLGIVHATGYPLYLLSCKILAPLLPGSDLGYQMNLLSTIYATLTLLNIVWIGSRLGDRGEKPYAVQGAIVAALMLAFSYYFWASAVVAEVYAFQAWLFSLALGCLLAWDQTLRMRWLALFGLTYGLCFANHMSVVLTVPGVLWYFIHRRESLMRTRRALPWVVLALLMGPAMYLYFPLRYQATSYNLAGSYDAAGRFTPFNLGSWRGVWWMVSGQMFHSLAFAYDLRASLIEWSSFLQQFWSNFLGAGVLLGGIGAVVSWRRHKWLISSWGLMIAALSLFYVNYRAVDKALMFVPVYLLWTLLVSAGCTYLLRKAAAVGKVGRLVNLLWILPSVALVLNYRYVDVSWDWRARTNAQAFLDEAAPNAVAIGWWTGVTPVQYLQYVEGQRPDVEVINRLMISPENLLRFVERRVDYQPVYLLAYDQELARLYDVSTTPGGFFLLSRGCKDEEN